MPDDELEEINLKPDRIGSPNHIKAGLKKVDKNKGNLKLPKWKRQLGGHNSWKNRRVGK